MVTEEYHEEPQSGWSVSGSVFELATTKYETRVLTIRLQRFVDIVQARIVSNRGGRGSNLTIVPKL